MARDLCPCGSGESYAACCRPFHRGEAAAPTCERLMRSRFAAFCKKEVDYLYRTLHPDHEERKLPEAEVKRALWASVNSCKYVRLEVLQAEGARVLFFAELYEKGKERSFVEASSFARDGGGWRYLSGVGRPMKASESRAGLRLSSFEA